MELGSGAAAPERAGGAARAELWELSLEEVLKVYEQPINEEQAWAVCFQGCRGLRGAPGRRRIRDTADILLRRDGSVGARREPGERGGDGRGRDLGPTGAPGLPFLPNLPPCVCLRTSGPAALLRPGLAQGLGSSTEHPAFGLSVPALAI